MKTFSNRRAVPVKQNGKMKWIYVSPEVYSQITKLKPYPNQLYNWIVSEILSPRSKMVKRLV